MVDGAPVGPANIAARDLAQELAALDPSLRPTAVGTPWPIGGKAFYSDDAHQHHIEVGFGEPPPKPAPVASPAPAPAPAGCRSGAAADPVPAADPAPAAVPQPARRRRARRRGTGGRRLRGAPGAAGPATGGTLSVGAVPSDPPAWRAAAAAAARRAAPAAAARRGRRRRAQSSRRPGLDRDAGRAEGAGRARGGAQVPRHAVPVGRLEALDRLRLLRA